MTKIGAWQEILREFLAAAAAGGSYHAEELAARERAGGWAATLESSVDNIRDGWKGALARHEEEGGGDPGPQVSVQVRFDGARFWLVFESSRGSKITLTPYRGQWVLEILVARDAGSGDWELVSAPGDYYRCAAAEAAL